MIFPLNLCGIVTLYGCLDLLEHHSTFGMVVYVVTLLSNLDLQTLEKVRKQEDIVNYRLIFFCISFFYIFTAVWFDRPGKMERVKGGRGRRGHPRGEKISL